VETIGTRFGALPSGLPAPQLPSFDWATAQNLFAPTVAIALLGAIESLLCARVADGLIGDRHDPNQELMAQGIANFAAPLFGGIAVTGNHRTHHDQREERRRARLSRASCIR
jgi:SulP family sulfate permease